MRNVREQMPVYKELNETQPGAVQNTWYNMFEKSNVEFAGLAMGVTVADETLEFRITIDGVVIDISAGIDLLFATNSKSDIATGTPRYTSGQLVIISGAPAGNVDIQSTKGNRWLKGRSVKIELRKTTAGGASALRLLGVYHKR